MSIRDITGMRFGSLTVVEFAGIVSGPTSSWRCRCDCGGEVVSRLGNLTCGQTKSCGCLRAKTLSIMRKTHGLTSTPEHRAWAAMKKRCSNPKHQYAHWHGRGIRVCERWANSFENFLMDLGSRPSPKHSIDRINVNGNYEPSNVRWATRSQQARNTTKTQYLNIAGRRICIADAADAAGLKQETLRKRVVSYGFTAEEAVSTPVLRNQFDKNHPSKKQKVIRRTP